MKGFPRHLNTRADYEFIRNHFPDGQWRPEYQALLNTRFAWLPVGGLAEEDAGLTDDKHKVIEHTDEQGNLIERIQEEWQEDPNAKIFRVGFTVAEVELALA